MVVAVPIECICIEVCTKTTDAKLVSSLLDGTAVGMAKSILAINEPIRTQKRK